MNVSSEFIWDQNILSVALSRHFQIYSWTHGVLYLLKIILTSGTWTSLQQATVASPLALWRSQEGVCSANSFWLLASRVAAPSTSASTHYEKTTLNWRSTLHLQAHIKCWRIFGKVLDRLVVLWSRLDWIRSARSLLGRWYRAWMDTADSAFLCSSDSELSSGMVVCGQCGSVGRSPWTSAGSETF